MYIAAKFVYQYRGMLFPQQMCGGSEASVAVS